MNRSIYCINRSSHVVHRMTTDFKQNYLSSDESGKFRDKPILNQESVGSIIFRHIFGPRCVVLTATCPHHI